MSKRPMNTGLKSNPTVRLTEKVGSRFLGEYVQTKDIKIRGKAAKLYEFKALDGDALITVKDGDVYKEAEVDSGEIVNVFGGKIIDAALAGATVGMNVEIIFNGVKTSAQGGEYNDFTVSEIVPD